MKEYRFYDFDDRELKALKHALECAISELDWACQDTGQELALLDEVTDELGERFNLFVEAEDQVREQED